MFILTNTEPFANGNASPVILSEHSESNPVILSERSESNPVILSEHSESKDQEVRPLLYFERGTSRKILLIG